METRDKLQQELKALKTREQEILKQLQTEPKNTSETLSNDEISRYSRQLLLPEWGVQVQQRLSKKTKGALIVGAGGLGCPAVQFLAAAGVSPIGIVDYDVVDVSNLHRQILHSESKKDLAKVDSIALAIQDLNKNVDIVTFETSLDSKNALDIVEKFDVVLDASDNVATRYLLNDACVLAKKPLVSGSALRFEGQLTVYNYRGGPTYRCLFPEPPPVETVTNCSDGGVVGVVPGLIGTLQAQEAMKILGDFGQVLSGKMLLYDAFSCRFTVVKLRPRSKEADSITQLIDYEQFCGAKASDKDKGLSLLDASDRISVNEYQKMKENGVEHLLIDVRSEPEMNICKLDGAKNYHIDSLDKKEIIEDIEKAIKDMENVKNVVVLCRRGNDSQRGVLKLRAKLDKNLVIKDIIGGLHAWNEQIDPDFPKY